MPWDQIGKANLEQDPLQKGVCCPLSWKSFHLVVWLKYEQDLSLLHFQQMACSMFGVKVLLDTFIHLIGSRVQRLLILLISSSQELDLLLSFQEVEHATLGDQMMLANSVTATSHPDKLQQGLNISKERKLHQSVLVTIMLLHSVLPFHKKNMKNWQGQTVF